MSKVVDPVDKLKEKVANEITTFFKYLRRGHLMDYDFILDEISIIDILECKSIDKGLLLTIIQYYLNGNRVNNISRN